MAMDQGEKFSNELYATRKDVQNKMNSSLIEGIWSRIIEYRSNFSRNIPLTNLNNRSDYAYCLTPKVSKRVYDFATNLVNLEHDLLNLKRNETSNIFLENSYKEILRVFARRYEIEVTDDILDKIVREEDAVLSPTYNLIRNYYNALKYIENFPREEISENTFGVFLQKIMGTDELTEYYRTYDINKNGGVNSGVYIGYSANYIDTSIEKLVEYIRNTSDDVLVKATVSYYYFYCIKPFANYSEDIAALLFKKVIANSRYESIASLINIESVVLNRIALENVIYECQKDNDLTYLIVYFADRLQGMFTEMHDNIDKCQRMEIKEDLYPEEKVMPEEPKEEKSLFEEAVEEKYEAKPLRVSPFGGQEQEKDIAISDFEVKEREVLKEEKIGPGLAVGNMSIGLTEEGAAKLEDRLMEINPELTRMQASFYARHCTLGMNYTVDQFKKQFGCAYETARSNMNILVELGYYQKIQFGKKFVYIPVKK